MKTQPSLLASLGDGSLLRVLPFSRTGRTVRSRSTCGFTLVELMVALVITAVMVTVLIRSMFTVERSWDTSHNRVVTNQNTRAAVNTMVRDLRMAGSGFSGKPVVTGGVVGNLVYPCRPGPAASGSDSLFITGSLSGVMTTCSVPMASPSDGLFVNDTDGFSVGDLVVITNGTEANMFEVTGVVPSTGSLEHSVSSPHNDPNQHVVWPSGGYSVGSTVVQVQEVAYWVDEGLDEPRLMRRLGSEVPLPIGFDVEELHVSYGLADGTVTSTPSDPAQIRTLFLNYVPRVKGAPGPASSISIRVQPRVFS